MKAPTKEQIGEFWEWCGFKQPPEGIKPYKDYDRYEYSFNQLPIIDLNNLFKYALPKLYELGWSYELKGYTYHTTDLYRNERRVSSKGLSDPALALFWAIYKVIEVEATARKGQQIIETEEIK